VPPEPLRKGRDQPGHTICFPVFAEKTHEFQVVLEDEMVIFRNRMSFQPNANVRYPILDAEAYHDAKLVAPRYDVYYLEQEWRSWWVESGMPELGFPGKAFAAFCKSRYLRNPNP
jgi:hypothetical protein